MICHRCGKDARTEVANTEVKFQLNGLDYKGLMSIYPDRGVCAGCEAVLLEIAATKIKEKIDKEFEGNDDENMET